VRGFVNFTAGGNLIFNCKALFYVTNVSFSVCTCATADIVHFFSGLVNSLQCLMTTILQYTVSMMIHSDKNNDCACSDTRRYLLLKRGRNSKVEPVMCRSRGFIIQAWQATVYARGKCHCYHTTARSGRKTVRQC